MPGDNVRQKFTGYQKDNETQLDFAEARMYENRFGRFTAVDPLLASGKSANPQTFNRYAYTSNNPVIRVDRNGLDWYKEAWTTDNGVVIYRPVWKPHNSDGNRWHEAGYLTFRGTTYQVGAASFAFKDRFTNKYWAFDFYQNRPGMEFDTLEGAQAQVAAWGTQALKNFIGGAVESLSLAGYLLGAADYIGAERDAEAFEVGDRAGTGAVIASAATGAGVVNAVGKLSLESIRVIKATKLASGPLSEFSHAGKFGFGSYGELRTVLGQGSGLQAHHLIEKRFANALGISAKEIKSIVLTKAEHDAFTKAWRNAIGYRRDRVAVTTKNATAADVVQAAREIYKNHPDILKALGL